jgi:ankyrin repeat protein
MWTPLMVAASAGRTDSVKALISHPVIDVNATNESGNTAL